MGNLSITEVRARLLLDRPYFGTAAMSLRPTETPGLNTMAVDKAWRLYYDPAALARWTNAECAAVLEHELMHLLRDHAGRQQGRENRKWNIAGDAEINDDLTGLPKGCIHPSQFGELTGQTAEHYFDAIPEQEGGDGGEGGQGGEGGDESEGSGSGPQSPSPDCGSGAGGSKRSWEKDGGDASEGISPLEADAIRKQTAQNIRTAGNAPAGLKRWADEILSPPRIPWSQILPAAVRSAIAVGTPQRFRYPARRESDFILPRLISGRPSAALVVDTSGSITDRDLALALAIIRNAAKHADLAIYACDTEAVRVTRLAPGCLVGGGGTDMMQGVKVAMEGRPTPGAVVIITDCYSPWSQEAPEVPVVILTAHPDQAPKWAKVITVEAE